MDKIQSDKQISDYFDIDFDHVKENRDWKTMETLNLVPGLVKENRLDEALKILDDQPQSLNDFDFIYAWKAFVYQKQQEFDQAEEILFKGIKNAKAKNLICDRLGYLYYEIGAMENAVKWWLKSVLVMTQSKASFLWEPFLYLAYTAKGCGRNKEYHMLMHIAWQSHGKIMLQKEAEADLLKKAADLKTSSVPEAIKILCTLLDPPDPVDNPESECLDDEKKLDTPMDKHRNHMEKKHFFSGWEWRLTLLVVAAVVAFLLFNFFFNRSVQVHPPQKQIPAAEDPKASIPLDHPPSSRTNTDQYKKPALDKDYKNSNTAGTAPLSIPDTPHLSKDKSPVSRPSLDARVDHKIKSGYLKNKTKQPILNLQKKINE